MSPDLQFWETLGVIAAAAVLLGLAVCAYRRARARRIRRHRCGLCRCESPAAPWKRRALALARPGPGWAARVRYGLTRTEYHERVRFGMPVTHPDWLSGSLPEDAEETLAALEAETWEDR